MARQSRNRIAVVDDDRAVRESLQLLLESHGFEAQAYESGPAFLADGPQQFDCLVVDLHMPEMTGLELVETLRLRGNPLPAVIATGRMDALLAKRVRQAEVLAVLAKPFADAELLALIDRALPSP
ncbi:MAG TPA: response regulator [Rhizomicrobium sp.]